MCPSGQALTIPFAQYDPIAHGVQEKEPAAEREPGVQKGHSPLIPAYEFDWQLVQFPFAALVGHSSTHWLVVTFRRHTSLRWLIPS